MTGIAARLWNRLLYRTARAGREVPVIDAHIPEGRILYAVGDIHGESALMEQLVDRIVQDAATAGAGKAATIIFLGDYIDRGPDSQGVLERLSGPPPAGVAWRFLRGNHEQALLDFLTDPEGAAAWLRFGGVETLASYGVLAPPGTLDPRRLQALAAQLGERLPPRHLDFLRGCEMMAVIGDYAFVHAGIDPALPLDQQLPEDLLWIREGFIDRPVRGKHVIVHGHTVVETPLIEGNRIAIDTGAYATGRLTALVLAGRERRILQAIA
ncbi:MAG: metallophosphoesterase family protein [Niveispirillum sp.]|uniref:metallophosphoesterase family protein n=1 Tax=Niveispirillum sp. TaxID=1917217 RepID=UPI003BA6983F